MVMGGGDPPPGVYIDLLRENYVCYINDTTRGVSYDTVYLHGTM